MRLFRGLAAKAVTCALVVCAAALLGITTAGAASAADAGQLAGHHHTPRPACAFCAD